MMESASLFDWAAKSRDAGMIEAEFAETLTGSDYPEALYAAICHVARRQCEVHVDDIIRHLKARPSHPNCAGQVWRRAIKDGVILKTGTVRPCVVDPVKHLHESPVYRSGLFHGRDA
jgi:hypothetical protein